MDINELLQRYKQGERDFSKINLPGANLPDVNLSGINLEGANLSEAKLIVIHFSSSIRL